MRPPGYFLLGLLLVTAYGLFTWHYLSSGGLRSTEDVVNFWGLLLLFTIASAAIMWEYFIKADFFEMPPIRYTRQFLAWLRVRQREFFRLQSADPGTFHIPAPNGNDDLRDFELEGFIRARRWNEAEQYIREKLEFYHSDLSQERLVTRFSVYTHYFQVLMDLRHKYLGMDSKQWARDIERWRPRAPES
ncbi:MAG: hypothetical protein V2G42_00080 [bacterium JZ-2024 1]